MGGQGLPEQDWIATTLREVLNGGELPARKQARVEGNRARHHLLAVTLNAFARLGQSAELTALEQGTVESFRRAGISDERLAEYGRIFAGASPEARARAFPDSAAGLTPETGYGWEELERDAPQIARDVSGMPHVQVVELAPGQDQAEPAPADSAAATAARAAGWSTTIIHAPAPPAAAPAAPPAAAPNADLDSEPQIQLYADNFYCDVESTELSADDELYFCFITLDGRNSTTWLSPTIENVDAGETHSFTPRPVIWDRPVNRGGLVVSVDVWEEDSGDHRDTIQATMNQVAASMIGELQDDNWQDLMVSTMQTGFDLLDDNTFSPVAQALTAGVFAFAQAIINWSQDDHVGTHTFVYSDAAVADIAAGHGDGDPAQEAVIDGTDHGEPRIRLRIFGYSSTPGRIVKLINLSGGKALGANQDSNDDGADAISRTYQDDVDQQWYLIPTGDAKYIVLNKANRKALTVHNASTENGADVGLWPYHGTPNEQWNIVDSLYDEYEGIAYKLLNVNSGKALTINGEPTDDGGSAAQSDDSGDFQRYWYIRDV
ncbi:RICIN domain-containing protein [Streptomyces sp. NPDC088729]|uniref:RICIN domain-containing protein n=1 Tax=Streptomyces sp. NPDC088729 TaxID=3365876 RepID=UPI0037F7D4D9